MRIKGGKQRADTVPGTQVNATFTLTMLKMATVGLWEAGRLGFEPQLYSPLPIAPGPSSLSILDSGV